MYPRSNREDAPAGNERLHAQEDAAVLSDADSEPNTSNSNTSETAATVNLYNEERNDPQETITGSSDVTVVEEYRGSANSGRGIFSPSNTNVSSGNENHNASSGAPGLGRSSRK